MKSKKIKTALAVSKRVPGLLARSLPGLIWAFVLILLLGFLARYLFTAPYFDIGEVLVSVDGKLASPEVRGQYKVNAGSNIFKADLKKLSANLSREHPEAKRIVIVRKFPNTILIKVTNRKPVAQIKRKKYFPVDDEGMVLLEVRNAPHAGLPVIMGVTGFFDKVEPGKVCETKSLRNSLALLREIDNSDLSKKVTEIRASGHWNLSFLTEEGLEVRVGGDDFGEKLKTLSRLFVELGDDIREVKYIDLRFKDPVIGPK